jgi:hypothetical protein
MDAMDAHPVTSQPHDVKQPTARGGPAGWFRVAAGFSALAALGSGYQAWSVIRPSADAIMRYAPSFGAAIAVASVLFAGASLLAIRHRAIAGLGLLFGYAIPATTLYVQQATIAPPSLLLVVSMLALLMANLRRSAVENPAA